MPERFKVFFENTDSETMKILIKAFPTAIIALIISTAVRVKKEALTKLNVAISVITGLGVVYFISPFIFTIENEKLQAILIGTVAICGEKIAEFITYKLDVDTVIKQLCNKLIDGISIYSKKQ